MSALIAALAAGAAALLLVPVPAESRLSRRSGRRDRGPGPVAEGTASAVHLPVREAVKSSPSPGSSRPPGNTAVTAARVDVPAARPMRAWLPRRPVSTPRAPDLDAVAALLDRLAALLRAGLGPRTVWEHLAATPGPCRPVCAFVAESLASGGDPGSAIAGAATLADPSRARRAPGLPSSGPSGGEVTAADVLRWLAAAMAVSARTGAPAADCVDRLAASVRAETAAADERAGALAGPQATVQVLAWLPAAGVLLGALVGASPVRTLVLTGAGRACLLAGGLLWFAGRTWSRALVRTAERAGA